MLRTTRQLPIQPRRDAWLEVDLNAIEANAQAIQNCVPKGTRIMAIIKADAYGHGAVMLAPILQTYGVSWFGVASIDEALQLRQAGIETPILVIGAIPDWAIPVAVEHNIHLTFFMESQRQAALQALAHSPTPLRIHIKVDTGMHRIGVAYAEAADFIAQCQNTPQLCVDGLFTHFATANDPTAQAQQWERFHQVLQSIATLPPCIHLDNTCASVIQYAGHLPNTAPWQRLHTQMQDTTAFITKHGSQLLARFGIAYCGYLPERNDLEEQGLLNPDDFPLTPAMQLKARIAHVQSLAPGEGVSYSATYSNTTTAPQRIATIPLGYADGVPRRLSNQLTAFWHGQPIPQVGNITMDQLMLDITACSDAKVGDTITLLGYGGTTCTTPSAWHAPAASCWLDTWANTLGTIEYELMCALRVRLPRVYTRMFPLGE